MRSFGQECPYGHGWLHTTDWTSRFSCMALARAARTSVQVMWAACELGRWAAAFEPFP